MAVGTCRATARAWLLAHSYPLRRTGSSSMWHYHQSFLLDRYPSGVRMDQAGLAAAWVHGDSMIYRVFMMGTSPSSNAMILTTYTTTASW
jgi:hypothetical protein